MKLLAIGAHPDDIEIFMFGLLYKCLTKGDSINTVIATDGAKGGVKFENLIELRKQETVTALKCFGTPFFLDLPDGSLGRSEKHFFALKSCIEKLQPDLIVTHSKNDYHSDHRSLSEMVNNIACHYIPILYCDTMMGINFQPDYYVDVTESFDEKKQAVRAHKTQNPMRFLSLIELMNSYRAAQCNGPLKSYAEGYKFVKSFPFSDISNLLPRSMEIRSFQIDETNGFL